MCGGHNTQFYLRLMFVFSMRFVWRRVTHFDEIFFHLMHLNIIRHKRRCPEGKKATRTERQESQVQRLSFPISKSTAAVRWIAAKQKVWSSSGKPSLSLYWVDASPMPWIRNTTLVCSYKLQTRSEFEIALYQWVYELNESKFQPISSNKSWYPF